MQVVDIMSNSFNHIVKKVYFPLCSLESPHNRVVSSPTYPKQPGFYALLMCLLPRLCLLCLQTTQSAAQILPASAPLTPWRKGQRSREGQGMVKHDQLCKLWNNLWRNDLCIAYIYIERERGPRSMQGTESNSKWNSLFLCLDCICIYIRSYLYICKHSFWIVHVS